MSKSLFNVRSRPGGDEDGDTGSIKARASNEPSRSLKVHNHGEKAPTEALSWLNGATAAFTFKHLNRFLNVRAAVAAFNQENASVGAFSMIVNFQTS